MKIEEGYVYIARALKYSDIWNNKPPSYLKLWLYILLSVNHKDTKLFPRGSNFFNLPDVAREIKLPLNTVYKCISWLKSARQITTQKTTRGIVVNVLQYNKYQDPKTYNYQTESETKSELKAKQKRNKCDTINNNDNNDNNVNNNKGENSSKETIGRIYDKYRELINDKAKLTEEATKKIKTRLKSFTLEELEDAITKFSGNEWRMEHNSDKGMKWFFESDDKIAEFLLSKQDRKKPPDKQVDEKGQRLAPNGKPLYIPTGII